MMNQSVILTLVVLMLLGVVACNDETTPGNSEPQEHSKQLTDQVPEEPEDQPSNNP